MKHNAATLGPTTDSRHVLRKGSTHLRENVAYGDSYAVSSPSRLIRPPSLYEALRQPS